MRVRCAEQDAAPPMQTNQATTQERRLILTSQDLSRHNGVCACSADGLLSGGRGG